MVGIPSYIYSTYRYFTKVTASIVGIAVHKVNGIGCYVRNQGKNSDEDAGCLHFVEGGSVPSGR